MDIRMSVKKITDRLARVILLLALAASTLSAPPAPPFRMTIDVRAALNHISADSLRGHLSFIASDALEGRKTPSRGLDLAAEYIAAQFRRAGLEPAGDDGYFQTASWAMTGRDMSSARASISNGGETLNVRPEQLSIGFSIAGFNFWPLDSALALDGAGVLKVTYNDAAALAALTREQVAGRVVLAQLPDIPRGERE